jgi:hypothetical protein
VGRINAARHFPPQNPVSVVFIQDEFDASYKMPHPWSEAWPLKPVIRSDLQGAWPDGSKGNRDQKALKNGSCGGRMIRKEHLDVPIGQASPGARP